MGPTSYAVDYFAEFAGSWVRTPERFGSRIEAELYALYLAGRHAHAPDTRVQLSTDPITHTLSEQGYPVLVEST